jgi:hypothetical protein
MNVNENNDVPEFVDDLKIVGEIFDTLISIKGRDGNEKIKKCFLYNEFGNKAINAGKNYIEFLNQINKTQNYEIDNNNTSSQQQSQKPPQGGKNSQYIMTKQGKRKIHVGKRGGKYYIMNKKKVYVK